MFFNYCFLSSLPVNHFPSAGCNDHVQPNDCLVLAHNRLWPLCPQALILDIAQQRTGDTPVTSEPLVQASHAEAATILCLFPQPQSSLSSTGVFPTLQVQRSVRDPSYEQLQGQIRCGMQGGRSQQILCFAVAFKHNPELCPGKLLEPCGRICGLYQSLFALIFR